MSRPANGRSKLPLTNLQRPIAVSTFQQPNVRRGESTLLFLRQQILSMIQKIESEHYRKLSSPLPVRNPLPITNEPFSNLTQYESSSPVGHCFPLVTNFKIFDLFGNFTTPFAPVAEVGGTTVPIDAHERVGQRMNGRKRTESGQNRLREACSRVLKSIDKGWYCLSE